MKAIILCAGYGTRMLPYTEKYQKTMIPVHGKPLLEYIIDGLIFAGFKDIILVVGYLKEQIIEYFEDGKNKNINIEYVEQTELNGTGGALLLCEDKIKSCNFFLTWGDILVPYSVYNRVYDVFNEKGDNNILVTNYMDDLSKGCAIFSKNGYIKKMIEKPSNPKLNTNLNNCGIFILSTEIFDQIKELNLSKRGELEVPEAISMGIQNKDWKVRIIKMKRDQFRGDFGDCEEYEKLNKDSSWLKSLTDTST
ncbi:MAG: NTP transferase domain-containing protein [Candidatus Lokiarchaeota archaeon]|nr:NTP transferase domain-containing protein [Candidatus Lokiarchaeota archaeon]MBD3198778.1 NTP transferase domain-containing protein [Candidatus Lokiarchaeota archaeon]